MGVSFPVDNYVTMLLTPRMLWYIKKISHSDVIEHFISQKYTCRPLWQDQAPGYVSMPWRRKGSQLREISPKFLLWLAGRQLAWSPRVLEKFSNTLLITPIMRAQRMFSHCGDTRSNSTPKAALWSGLRLPCLCLFSSIVIAQLELNFTQFYVFKPSKFLNIFSFSSVSNP